MQLIPQIESHYLWKGKKESSREILLLIKTRKSSYVGLERLIKRLHSYETPEIIALPVVRGSQKYLKWIAQNTLLKIN